MKRQRASSLWRDTSGAIAPLVAVMAVVLIASAALALDFGAYYVGNRNLRAATEAAALSAASTLGIWIDSPDVAAQKARQKAIEVLADNGYPNTVLKSAEFGRYCADIGLETSARFVATGSNSCPGNGRSTAVRLKTELTSNQYFAGILGTHSPIPAMAATATAARIDEAGVGITTGVLGLSGLTASVLNLANTILTSLAGISINLDSSQLSALLGTNIDAATFFHALAAGDQNITYGTVANSTVTLSAMIAAAQAASGNAPAPALTGAFAKFAGAGGLKIPLKDLFDLGVWEKMPIGDANEPQNLKAGLNAYQLMSYALQAQAGGINITLNSTQANMPNIVQVKLIDSWQGQVARARFAFGPQGETQVNTSALRVQLTLRVNNLGSILNGIGLSALNNLLLAPIMNALNLLATDVPVLIDIGPGSASVSSISCGPESSVDARVKVDARSGFLALYLGNLPANAMSSTMPPITASDVSKVDLVPNLLGLNLLGPVKIKAAVDPINNSGTLDFRQGNGGDGVIGHPPLPGTSARVGSRAQLGSMFTQLGGNLQVDATILGLNTGPLVNGIIANVGTLVGGLLTALGVDGLVDNLLAALGIQPGFADVWVTGVRCGVPVLV